MTDIYLIRHAQASFGTSDYDRLSRRGIEQASVLADYFMELEAYFPKIFTGSKHRQIETAEIIRGRLQREEVHTEMVVAPELDEFDVDGLLQVHMKDMVRRYPSFQRELAQSSVQREMFQSVFLRILRFSRSNACRGDLCETFHAFKTRVGCAIRRIIHESRRCKKVAVVTSGGVLGVIMQMIHGLTDEEAIRRIWNYHNASVSICRADGDRLALKLDNSAVHLKHGTDHTLLTWV